MRVKYFLPIIICLAVLSSPLGSFAQSSAAPANSSWSFFNWSLPPTLPWSTYQDTFIGIPPTYDPVAAPFDTLFYDQVYKTLAGGTGTSSGGNCYGMSLMSLLLIRDGGHLGFCAPVNQYSGDLANVNTGPTDPRLALAINIMHGHQVNLPSVQFILNIVANHNNRDAAYAVQQFNYWQSRGDFTLVSVTQDLNPQDGGHTLVAYGLGGPGNQNIMVYDPDRPWLDPTSQLWYESGQNFIQINGHSWSFTLAGSLGTWSGDPNSGGNLIITPVSVTAPDSPTPVSLGGQIIGQLLSTLLLTGQGASIQQVTDDHGKRLFIPGTFNVDTDPATGMRNTMPLFISDQARGSGTSKSVLFHFGTSGGALHVAVSSGSAGYTLSSYSGRTIVSVTAHGGKGSETITLRYPTTREAGVVLDNTRGTSDYDVQIDRAEIPRQRVNVFTSSHLTATPRAQVEVGLTNNGHAISISSRGAPTHYDLELRTIARSGQQVLSKTQISQDAGTVHTIRPNDWQNLKTGGVSEQVKPISDPSLLKP